MSSRDDADSGAMGFRSSEALARWQREQAPIAPKPIAAMSDTLPPLPEPSAGTMLRPGREREKVYTADQMRAYAKRAREEAIEACARVCDDYGRSVDNEWNQRLGVANDLKDIAEECALAIRALKEKP